MDESSIPVHLEPFQESETCEKRLWIGNLDMRINEFQLLKMVRAYGNIEKFDMLFHRSGPNAGHPRGFAFVTYKSRNDAIKAMNSLNGVYVGTKRIAVKFAKNTTEENDKQKQELGIPVLAGASVNPESKLSKKTAIQSIEAKLKLMESNNGGEEFVINKLAAMENPVVPYQRKQIQAPQKCFNHRRRHQPYHKRR